VRGMRGVAGVRLADHLSEAEDAPRDATWLSYR
jgi:hypothetical protein